MPEYRHTIGGAIGDKPHEPGDPVDASVRPAKVKEWLEAGVIEKVKPVKGGGVVPKVGKAHLKAGEKVQPSDSKEQSK